MDDRSAQPTYEFDLSSGDVDQDWSDVPRAEFDKSEYAANHKRKPYDTFPFDGLDSLDSPAPVVEEPRRERKRKPVEPTPMSPRETDLSFLEDDDYEVEDGHSSVGSTVASLRNKVPNFSGTGGISAGLSSGIVVALGIGIMTILFREVTEVVGRPWGIQDASHLFSLIGGLCTFALCAVYSLVVKHRGLVIAMGLTLAATVALWEYALYLLPLYVILAGLVVRTILRRRTTA